MTYGLNSELEFAVGRDNVHFVGAVGVPENVECLHLQNDLLHEAFVEGVVFVVVHAEGDLAVGQLLQEIFELSERNDLARVWVQDLHPSIDEHLALISFVLQEAHQTDVRLLSDDSRRPSRHINSENLQNPEKYLLVEDMGILGLLQESVEEQVGVLLQLRLVLAFLEQLAQVILGLHDAALVHPLGQHLVCFFKLLDIGEVEHVFVVYDARSLISIDRSLSISNG